MQLRPATSSDQPTIKQMIRDAGINPMSLDWRHFVVADDDGKMIGIGQIKTHGDSSRELASIAVIPERQHQGIASQIIQHLLASVDGAIYLTCRDQLESFYAQFGFRKIERDKMTPYFRRLIRLANIFMRAAHGNAKILVMKKDQT